MCKYCPLVNPRHLVTRPTVYVSTHTAELQREASSAAKYMLSGMKRGYGYIAETKRPTVAHFKGTDQRNVGMAVSIERLEKTQGLLRKLASEFRRARLAAILNGQRDLCEWEYPMTREFTKLWTHVTRRHVGRTNGSVLRRANPRLKVNRHATTNPARPLLGPCLEPP